jgi:hypothetical protein
MAAFPALPDETIMFRAVLEKSWKTKDGKLKWQTFKRMKKDTDGVSLFTTVESATEELTRPFFGMASVHIGRVRQASTETDLLDVIQDAETHANITGIPYIYDKPEDEQNLLNDKMIFLCRRILEQEAAALLPDD